MTARRRTGTSPSLPRAARSARSAIPAAVEAALSRLAALVERSGGEVRALAAGAADEAAPARAVAGWLYERWYAAPDPAPPPTPIAPGRATLVPALRAALAATGTWETGWVALGSGPGGAVLAGRGALTRLVAPGAYANLARPAAPPAPGDGLAVLDRLEWVDEPTGFWGARSVAAEPAAPLVRAYLSVGPERVGPVLRALVPALDRSGRPWSLKCPARAAGLSRVDSLVVYLQRGDWPALADAVHAVAHARAADLREAVPPLALPLARGLAFAESPPDGTSFGDSRCAALAPGVLGLLSLSPLPRRGALAVLVTSRAAGGIAPARPWLCP